MPDLFTPIRIRGVEIRNRIVMPSMTTRLADAEGYVTPALIDYYLARAQGEAGLITVEMASPEAAGRHRAGEIGLSHDHFVPGLQELTSRLKEAGARVSIQIGHAGGHTRPEVIGCRPVAPSALPHEVQEGDTRTIIPETLTPARIQTIVAAFAAAAARAKRAGFDLVELHGAHGYLIAQFLSPLDNRRTDDYGGSLPHRARFALEVVRACRRQVGDMPIIFRLSVDEYAPGGLTPDEAVQVCRWLEEAGADAVHVTAACYRSQPSAAIMIPPMRYPAGVFLHLARAVKAAVNIPVIAVGRLHDPALASRVIATGDADMVAIGRQLIADPAWPRKVRQGEVHAIRPCIACNTCVDSMREGSRIRCLVNPLAGREADYTLTPASRSRQVVVVGGGPAGMEAAAILASRGHRVTLYERQPALGGQLRLAAKAPLFQNVETQPEVLLKLVAYQADHLARLGVEVKRGQAATPEMIAALRPELVILATGAAYCWPWRWLPHLLDMAWGRNKLCKQLLRLPWVKRLLYTVSRKPNSRLFGPLQAGGIEVHRIGDCHQVGKTDAALAAAAALAYRL